MRYPHRTFFQSAVALLLLMMAVPAVAQSTCGATVTANTGDSLESLAARCNTTTEELIRLNPDAEFVLQAGEVLRLPTYGPAQGPPLVSVTPLSGAPGTSLAVTANGFPAYTEVELRLGSVEAGTSEIRRVVTTANGVVREQFAIPDEGRVGQSYILIVETTDGFTNARSFPIEVTFNRGFLFQQTDIYLVALGDAGANGLGVGCRDSIVPASVPIAPTIGPLGAALNTLLASSTRTFPGTSYYNALNQSDLRVSRVAVIGGEAQIELSGSLVVGGACDVPRIKAQLEQVALQYSTVSSVAITVNGTPLDEVLGIAPPPTAIPD